RVRVRGRVGALIEVGTGLHPELTGRENVSLYGRILGLSSRDVVRRFDEIVDFSGIGAAIDQPVKQYSSGMQLRLGFSVAAHLEPDVLLVDEALSVGDAGFQHRCVDKMSQIVRGGGTLVLVSHSMNAIETLCTRAILLDQGRVVLDGPGRDVVQEYLRRSMEGEYVQGRRPEPATDQRPALEILRISLHDSDGNELDSVRADEPLTVRVHYLAHEPVVRPAFSIGFGDSRLGAFSSASMLVDGETPDVVEGEGHLDCVFERLPLRPRAYEIWCGVRGEHGVGSLVDFTPHRVFEVAGELPPGKAAVTWGLKTPVEIPYEWVIPAAVTRNGR
ncbi:MAG TPA: Wzt carbohydrate-binding domain-containing protein, partial [Gaiellaceae bacterium]|nr:Wzt carbohydrate-binding domain-containing protein [Gaiellaceae bacterium]